MNPSSGISETISTVAAQSKPEGGTNEMQTGSAASSSDDATTRGTSHFPRIGNKNNQVAPDPTNSGANDATLGADGGRGTSDDNADRKSFIGKGLVKMGSMRVSMLERSGSGPAKLDRSGSGPAKLDRSGSGGVLLKMQSSISDTLGGMGVSAQLAGGIGVQRASSASKLVQMAALSGEKLESTVGGQRRASFLDFEDEIKAVQSLAAEAEKKIMSKEQTEMMVVPLQPWKDLGRFPRSSDKLQRPYDDGDIVVFVSHRWWSPVTSHPDNDDGDKYRILCRGLEAIQAAHPAELTAENVVIWVDFACIDQDDMELQMKGIQSLITYAARSDFVLIPVEARQEEAKAFAVATQPSQLINYGERAWCRLETYIFMCLADITGKTPHVYGFGEAAVKSIFMCFKSKSVETLRSLSSSGTSQGVKFGEVDLPSSGKLTVEKDRDVIHRIEEDVRTCYVQTAILSEVVGFAVDHKKGFVDRTKGTMSLQGKQLSDTEMDFLLENIHQMKPHILKAVKVLDLSHNLLAAKGIALLGKICDKSVMRNIRELDLSYNKRMGTEGFTQLLAFLPKTNIATLKLAACEIGNTIVKQIAARIPECKKIRNLHLDHNRIGSYGGNSVLVIIKAMIKNAGGDSSKIMCTLDENPLGAEFMMSLNAKLNFGMAAGTNISHDSQLMTERTSDGSGTFVQSTTSRSNTTQNTSQNNTTESSVGTPTHKGGQ